MAVVRAWTVCRSCRSSPLPHRSRSSSYGAARPPCRCTAACVARARAKLCVPLSTDPRPADHVAGAMRTQSLKHKASHAPRRWHSHCLHRARFVQVLRRAAGGDDEGDAGWEVVSSIRQQAVGGEDIDGVIVEHLVSCRPSCLRHTGYGEAKHAAYMCTKHSRCAAGGRVSQE